MSGKPIFERFIPFLFRKLESGPQLQQAEREAAKIYGTAVECPSRRYKAGHITVHQLEFDCLDQRSSHTHYTAEEAAIRQSKAMGHVLRRLSQLLLLFVWLLCFPLALKFRTVIAACCYTITESVFTYCERGTNYTSWDQFYCNLIWVPFLLDLYGGFLGDRPVVYVLCFPFNIYLLEVVVGHYLIWLHGYNVAWCYLDYSDAMFNGTIRIAHAPFWMALGCFTCLVYPMLTVWTDAASTALLA